MILPFDFDSKDLRDAWGDAKKLFNYLVDMGITCVLTFSGRKGFHVLVKYKF